jgi:hypothetical protein
MGKNYSSTKKTTCQQYLNNRTRIHNKETKLKRLLKGILKEKSKQNIIRSCRIGREKEGFQMEDFKKKKSIKENK